MATAIKVNPLFSLGLLFLTYSTLGWKTGFFLERLPISQQRQRIVIEILWTPIPFWIIQYLVWGGVIAGTLLLAGTLTSPLANMRVLITRWSRSEISAFVSILGLTVFLIFILAWIQAASYILILMAATTLARLDIDQGVDFTKLQDFLTIGGVSLLGLAMGAIIHALTS
jgi:hypothetical protein